jgi:ABC-type phosphate transport system substrate-binding protein
MGAGLALAATASVAFAAAPAAHGATTCADTNTCVVTAAGSDTTMDVMGSILASDGGGHAYNIKAGAYQSTQLDVPADDFCLDHKYHGTTPGAGELAAPDGSGNGRNALANSINAASPYNGGGVEAAPNGCIDIARSSGYSSSFLTGNSEFFAFAIDAVTWGSASPNAPATLTQAQLQGIYNCTYTNWNQVGGQDGAIQRVMFQSGSGTQGFFMSNLLGISAESQLPAGVSGTSCPPIVHIQENQYFDMFNGSNTYGGGFGDASQYANAIAPYSAGKWAYQASHSTNPTVDLRAGFRPGGLTVSKGSATGPVWADQWNGASWQLNNMSVVGAPTPAGRSENITTTTGSKAVTLVPTTTTKTGNTTINSFNVTATAGTFDQTMVGGAISGTGIPASTIISAVSTDGSTLTISNKATATNSGVTLTISSHFAPTDAGATLASANLPVGAKIDFIIDSTHAVLTASATGTGTGVATTITPVGQVHEVSGVASTKLSTTLTAAAATFNASDVGKVIDSTCTAGGTTITAVSGPGDTATISPAASATCGSFTARIGFTAISVGNVQNTIGVVAPFPGARFVYNVLAVSSPSHTQARNLVGYQDTSGGAKSPLCSGAHDSTAGGSDDKIADNGFLPIPPHTSAGNNTGVTCYLFTP